MNFSKFESLEKLEAVVSGNSDVRLLEINQYKLYCNQEKIYKLLTIGVNAILFLCRLKGLDI